MLIQDAQTLVARKLQALNDRQARCGRPPLQREDFTPEQRVRELYARVNLMAADGMTMDLLASLGAHVYACMLALDQAEVMDPASGEAA